MKLCNSSASVKTSPSGSLCVGVDIGGTNIRACIFNHHGQLCSSAWHKSVKGGKAVVEAITDTINAALERFNATQVSLPLAGIGIGIPGTVETASGTVRNAVNLGIKDLTLGPRISRKFDDVPVVIENDVNVAAVGASIVVPEGRRSLAYLNLGTGVAAGFCVDGKVFTGSHGAAGEIGHISLDPDGALCKCGQRGCLETLISGSALASLWPTETGYPGEALFFAAAAGDHHAQEVRDTYCLHLFQAVVIIALSVDPAIIILGGGVSNLGRQLIDGLDRTIRSFSAQSTFLRSLHLDKRIRLAPQTVNIAALGAAHLAAPFTALVTV